MFGRLVASWDGLFSGVLAVCFTECTQIAMFLVVLGVESSLTLSSIHSAKVAEYLNFGYLKRYHDPKH